MSKGTNGEFVWRDVGELAPHPAAIQPIDDEDQRAIGESIAEFGVLSPLLITPENLIIDGVNRWRQAQEHGVDTLPCIVHTEPPEDVVAQCLVARRKFSTGTRILVYCERHRDAILKTAELCREMGQQFKNASKQSIGSRDRMDWEEWTAEAIAARLRVSDKDVRLAIELLYRMAEKVTLPDLMGEVREADKEYLGELKRQRDLIICGASAIRTWRRGFQGRTLTAGRGRAETDYGELAKRSTTGLVNVLGHMGKLADFDRALLDKAMRGVLAAMPEYMREWVRNGEVAAAVPGRKPGGRKGRG